MTDAKLSSSKRMWTKKGSMNVTESQKAEMKVVPLFGGVQEQDIPDPLEALIAETEQFLAEEIKLEKRDFPLVTETQFPDQSMFTLDQQLGMLKESLGRIKFYLLDLDDLLPK